MLYWAVSGIQYAGVHQPTYPLMPQPELSCSITGKVNYREDSFGVQGKS